MDSRLHEMFMIAAVAGLSSRALSATAIMTEADLIAQLCVGRCQKRADDERAAETARFQQAEAKSE